MPRQSTKLATSSKQSTETLSKLERRQESTIQQVSQQHPRQDQAKTQEKQNKSKNLPQQDRTTTQDNQNKAKGTTRRKKKMADHDYAQTCLQTILEKMPRHTNKTMFDVINT